MESLPNLRIKIDLKYRIIPIPQQVFSSSFPKYIRLINLKTTILFTDTSTQMIIIPQLEFHYELLIKGKGNQVYLWPFFNVIFLCKKIITSRFDINTIVHNAFFKTRAIQH